MARILIIDDDAEIRGLLRNVLTRDGHQVIEASDGNEGKQRYREEPTDLVIIDMIMPEKYGWETILELRREFPGVKCVGISGGGRIGPFSHLMMAKKFGAIKVFSKPFDLAQFRDGVREVLQEAPSAMDDGNQARPPSGRRKSVLVVDPYAPHAWTLCEGLTGAGHSVIDTSTAEYALEIIQKRRFEVVLVDVPSSKRFWPELIQRLRAQETKPLVIAMADLHSPSLERVVVSRGADHFVGKPVDVDQVLSIISPSLGFSGRLEGVDILEYLQFVLLSGRKMVIEIIPVSGNSCRLYVGHGSILHAICGGVEGEEAFFQCIHFKGGEFVNLPWNDPDRESICKPGELLLFEAARRRDETQWKGR